jgi:outer membrane receptor for ferrienterochelin and colicins
VAASSVFKITPDLQFTALANYSASHALTADPTDFGTVGNQYTTTYSVGFGVNWQSPIGLITNSTYFNHSLVQLFETTSGGNGTSGGPPYTFYTDLLVSRLQDQFKLGTDHTFRVTLEYRFKTFSNDGVQLVMQKPAIAQNGIAVSGAWIWRMSDRWSWTNAARLDHTNLVQTGQIISNAYFSPSAYNQTVNAFSANSDLVFKATEKDSFRLGYGRGIQLPSLLNLGWDITQNFGTNGIADYEANPKLKPTTVDDYSIDYDRKIGFLNSNLKLSIYYEFNRDITVAAIGTSSTVLLNGVPAPVVLTENVGNSAGWGGEIQLKGSSPSGFRWDLSYSYSRVADQGLVKTTVDYQGSAPQHHVRVILGYTRNNWEFDVNGQVVSGTNMLRSLDGGSTQSPFPVRGYTSVSGRIGYRFNSNLTFALSGTNLNQSVTKESPYPAIRRLVLASLTARF